MREHYNMVASGSQPGTAFHHGFSAKKDPAALCGCRVI
jgi:hypothetical protein